MVGFLTGAFQEQVSTLECDTAKLMKSGVIESEELIQFLLRADCVNLVGGNVKSMKQYKQTPQFYFHSKYRRMDTHTYIMS